MKKLFDMEIYQSGDVSVENTSAGDILISPTEGGAFWGEYLNGNILPLGAGCTYTPCPGKNDIEATMLLQTEEGEHIIMSIEAYFDIEPDKEKKLENGECVASGEYYYKGTVAFKTGSEKYKWLERKICVFSCVIELWQKLVFSVYII